jgi:hypothetical protein
VFGRKGSHGAPGGAQQSAEPVTAETAGKGRPTPRRKEAEQANRRPLVSGGRSQALRAGATKQERKAARQAQRAASQSERVRTRQALLSGDERHYPPRDAGPARRWARNYVDARHNLGEYFLFLAIAFLVLSQFRITLLNSVLAVLVYVAMLAMGVDLLLLRRRVIRETTARYGTDKSVGVGMYAISRALLIRRMRMPRPQVSRGEYPD